VTSPFCVHSMYFVYKYYMKRVRQVAELNWGKRIQMTQRSARGCHDPQEMLLMWACVLLVMTPIHCRGICCYRHLQVSRWRHHVLSLKFHHNSLVHTCKCKCFSLEHHLQRWKVNDQHLPYHRQRHCQQEHTVAEQADREDRFGL